MPSPRTLPLTMTKPSVYTSEDVFREPSEGRSLHDDANLFYRKVMGLETPIKAVTQPTINEIHDAIGTKLSGNDFFMWSMVYGLQLSQLEEVWPGAKTPPENSIGKLWCACRDFGPAAMSFHHAENVHKMASQKVVNVVSPVKTSSVHSPPKEVKSILKKSRTSIPKKSKPSPVKRTTSQKNTKVTDKGIAGGKKKGVKNWSSAQINLVLEMTEEILPAGKEMWEQVAVRCHDVDKSWVRPGESCKAKFEKMAFAKQPTGQADIPLHILRAKEIKEKISQNEVLGCVYQNEEAFLDDSDDDEITSSSLSSASLLTESNGVRRPVTKSQKAKDLSEAIAQIGKDNLAGAAQLTSALNNMAEALKTTNPSVVTSEDASKDSESKLAKEFDAMKDDITNIKGTMAAILELLKSK